MIATVGFFKSDIPSEKENNSTSIYDLWKLYEETTNDDIYGGAYIDEAHNIIHVNIVDSTGDEMKKQKKHRNVVYHLVEYSKKQLTNAQNVLQYYWAELGIVESSIDIVNNVVEVKMLLDVKTGQEKLNSIMGEMNPYRIIQVKDVPELI